MLTYLREREAKKQRLRKLRRPEKTTINKCDVYVRSVVGGRGSSRFKMFLLSRPINKFIIKKNIKKNK